MCSLGDKSSNLVMEVEWGVGLRWHIGGARRTRIVGVAAMDKKTVFSFISCSRVLLIWMFFEFGIGLGR